MIADMQNSHCVELSGLNVHYWEHGPHLPKTVVMLRGFRSSDEGLMSLAAQFSDFHLIIPDFPGYGQTDELTIPHTVSAYAKVIFDLLISLKLKEITLIGHSFGGLVALVCASQHPELISKLVLIAPVSKPNIISRFTSLYYIIGRVLPEPLGRHWLTSRSIHQPIRNYVVRTQDPQLHAQIMSEGERELKELRPNINIENYLSLINFDPTQWLEQLEVHALVIAGDKDRLTRPSDIIDTYSSEMVTIKIIEGLGHYSPTENPAELRQLCQAWFSEETGKINP